MRDNQGNKILKGNLLLWCISKEAHEKMQGRLMVRVLEVNEPQIEGNPNPPSITLMINIPMTALPGNQEIQLQDFYGLRNPVEEKAVEGMLQ